MKEYDTVNFRLSIIDREHLQKLAGDSGLSVSDVLRAMIRWSRENRVQIDLAPRMPNAIRKRQAQG
jgi:hypothetical protein